MERAEGRERLQRDVQYLQEVTGRKRVMLRQESTGCAPGGGLLLPGGGH